MTFDELLSELVVQLGTAPRTEKDVRSGKVTLASADQVRMAVRVLDVVSRLRTTCGYYGGEKASCAGCGANILICDAMQALTRYADGFAQEPPEWATQEGKT